MATTATEIPASMSWAILNAELLAQAPLPAAMSSFEEHVVTAAEIYGRTYSGHVTQRKTAERLASSTGQVIADWQETGTLPPTREDYRPDLASPRQAREFDLDSGQLVVAVNRLKVVRMGLPELLRKNRPDGDLVKGPLAVISRNLGRICMPGRFSASRPTPGRYYY